MTSFRLRYVESFTDRHGIRRYYFRKGKGPRTALPGKPGSAEFMAVYGECLECSSKPPENTRRHAHGSFAALAELYFQAPEFMGTSIGTQDNRRRIIERFLRDHGHRMVAQMKREHVSKILGAKAATPAGANNLLKRLRALIQFAMALGWRDSDPTAGLRRYKEGEHHTWSEDEIALFESRWPLGSRERTAFALHLYTGQRRSDVCRMRWTDIEEGRIRVVQQKTGERLLIRLHPALVDALSAWPRKHISILVTSQGKPYVVESYGNWMANAIGDAGLPSECVLHGLRKAAGRRLAEAGCTEKQIAAVLGHRTLAEVARYTRAADQSRLADVAILSLPSKNKTRRK